MNDTKKICFLAALKLAWGVVWQTAPRKYIRETNSEKTHSPGRTWALVRRAKPILKLKYWRILNFWFPLCLCSVGAPLSPISMEASYEWHINKRSHCSFTVWGWATLLCPTAPTPPLRAEQGCESEAEGETSAAPGAHWHRCTQTLGTSTKLLWPTLTRESSSNWQCL